MAVTGEEVAGNIEERIREAIERMVSDIRSTVKDVREAIDQQLDAALQSVQADANAITFKNVLTTALAEYRESIEPVAAAAPEPVVESRPDASGVKRGIQAIEGGKTQVEILNALLDQCLQYGSRAALLILKGEAFSGWKGAGFSAHGGNDEAIKRFTATPGTYPQFDQVARLEQVVHWDGANFAPALGVAAPSRAVLVPMVIKDKVAAAMYVDAVEADESKFDSSAVEVLVFTTGLLIDTLAIRKKTPSPSLSRGDETVAVVAPPVAPPPAAAVPPKAAPSLDSSAARRPAPSPAANLDSSFTRRPPVSSAPPPAAAPALTLDSGPTFNAGAAAANLRLETEPEPAPAPRPAATSFATTAMPAITETPVAPPPPKPTPAPPMGDIGEGKPSTQFIPPPGLARGGPFGGPQNEEARKHDEARRFARLLVSEIKLYNEAKVEQGRKNKDLYERLKEDIDRSRQMYDERIVEDVRKTSNYFYDELVRILADGNSDALGL